MGKIFLNPVCSHVMEIGVIVRKWKKMAAFFPMSLCGFVPLVTELVFELNFLLYIFLEQVYHNLGDRCGTPLLARKLNMVRGPDHIFSLHKALTLKANHFKIGYVVFY